MKPHKIIVSALFTLLFTGMSAQNTIDYEASAIGLGASGDFAPYMLGSWQHGKTPMAGHALLDLKATKDFDLTKRVSWEAGAEFLTGYSAKTSYDIYRADGAWTARREGPAAAWLQQLYGSVKYRGAFLTVGLKEYGSHLVDNRLSSGDLTVSTNARPIAQVRAGFVDYQNIPFTKGWVQIEGEIGYGKMADSDYLKHHYNYYNNHIATGVLYTYKRAYFRTKPTEPLVVTIGAQAAGMFGGTSTWYQKGEAQKTHKNPQDLKAFWEMFIPGLHNGDGFVEGNHVGTWDFKAAYSFGKDRCHEVAGYFEWYWEDGSSMGKRNKWDGLWGIEYHRRDAGKHALRAAVAEYIDFRDQSGPLHWAPNDSPGTSITTEATGGDDYYNNTTSNAWSNFGMAIGNPFVLAPVYNKDGFIQFLYTRSRGVHLAAEGDVTCTLGWIAKFGWSEAHGNGRVPTANTLHNTSAMIGASLDATALLPGLSATLNLAIDRGDLRGNNFGAQLTVKYTGSFNLNRD